MSAQKARNRKGRMQKNVSSKSQHVETEVNTLSKLELDKPLLIVRASKENLQRGTIDQEHNHTNSDNDAVVPPVTIDLSRLPKVQFKRLNDDSEEEEVDIEYLKQQKSQEEQLLSSQSISQIYKRPENHYVHYIEPSERELYNLVEYDMDEQDKHWLNMYNKERRKQVLDDISPYLFEYIMDKLEKEWFNLIRNAPKPETKDQEIFPEDSACAVCDDTEVENSNAIVFCDGCNVAVHQDCYGIPYIPEGQWLCRKCMISPEFPVSCIFCPNEGGAFKQTNTNQWGHLLCAIWIPEVGVSNPIYMEPIDTIENVPKNRWKLTCSICRKRQGACIQCDNKHCFSAFHVTCAKAAGLCMKMNPQALEGAVILKAYCEKHTPKEYNYIPPRISSQGRGRGRARGRRELLHANNKVARAHQLCYSTGVPIVPDVILSKIDHLPCVKLSGARKRQQLVTAIAHYWSLKREFRRGAPLLKRLHLEPWTANTKYNVVDRKSFITTLRANLDTVRMLSEQVQKRERQKLERTKKQKDYLQMILFPVEYFIQPLLARLMDVDRKKYFLNPVTEEEAPDYHKIIQQPICFADIQNKLILHEYHSLDQFESDIELICQNSMKYNASDTSFYKAAIKLKSTAKKLLSVAKSKLDRLELLEDGTWNEAIDSSIFSYEDDSEMNIPSIVSEPIVEVETEEERQLRLEKERIKDENRRLRIQRIQEGRARAKALREENELKGISSKPPVPKTVRNLRTRHTVNKSITDILSKKDSQKAADFDEQVTNLQVKQSNVDIMPEFHNTYDTTMTGIDDKPAMMAFQPQYPQQETLLAKDDQQLLMSQEDEIRKRQRSSSPDNGSTTKKVKMPDEGYQKIRAAIGWVYLDEDEQVLTEGQYIFGSKKTRQSRNGIPIPSFEKGEIVWARVSPFPSHPAKFLNYSDEEAGPKLVACRRYQGDVLVEFLKVPEIHRYGWVGRRTLCRIGDPEIDKKRLSEALKRKTFIEEAKEGYRYAASLLGIENTESILQSVFDTSKSKKSNKKRHHKQL